MDYGKVSWLKASTAALALGAWAAACTSANETPNDGAVTAAGPATGSVGSGGATGSDTVAGATPTTTTDASTTTTGQTAAVTGMGGAGAGTTDGAVASAVGGATSATPTSAAATGGAASTVATTTASTTGGGTAGTGEEACTAPPQLAVPLVADFESYDGGTVALEWSFEFNNDGSGENLLYGGFFDASDGSGTPTLDMVGSDTSTWAVKATNTEASDWGGGIGIWLGCMDASAYTGLSLAVRGTTPNQNAVDIGISVDGLSGGVRTTITVTDLLATYQLPFTDFTNEYEETTNGSNINGLSINAVMMWYQDESTEEWFPTPGGYELVVDDISFY